MDILSLLIFLPLFIAVFIAMIPAKYNSSYKFLTLFTAITQLIIALYIFCNYSNHAEGYQFLQKKDWIYLTLGSIGNLNIDYFIGVDGISAGMLLLSSIVMIIASLSSWEIKKNLKGYFVLLNVLSMAVMGVFVALDFFLFYLFYELMLLPLYFLIGMWGGPNREYASIKFFLYTLFGSVFMLLVMVGLYFSVKDPVSGDHTFNMLYMMNPENYIKDGFFSLGGTLFGYSSRIIAFIVLFIGFAIKVPVVPFHTWLPDAHVEAPTPVSIILAGILLKVGAYAIIRICYGIFPEAAIHFSYWIGLLGMISIIYGAFNALNAFDLKRMIAYSSVSHMGFVLIGLASFTSEGINGAVYQMFSHGILSAMLFYLVGVIYNRVHDRNISNFRGLAQQMPMFTIFVVIAFFGSLGLPGMSGFIGEVFTLLGAFKSGAVNGLLPHWIAIVSSVGIFIGAAYFLWTLQRMFFGEKRFNGEGWESKLKDLSTIEYAVLIPLAIITILIGIFPSLLFDVSNQSVNQLINDSMIKGSSVLNNLLNTFTK